MHSGLAPEVVDMQLYLRQNDPALREDCEHTADEPLSSL